MNTIELGKEMEVLAAKYLETVRGWRVLARRVRFREGEIDLIMETPSGELRFVEVKGRRSKLFGDVRESVTAKKVQRLRRAIGRWRAESKDRRPGQLFFVGIFEEANGVLSVDEWTE